MVFIFSFFFCEESASRKRVRFAGNCEENRLGFREDEATTQEEAGIRIRKFMCI